MSGIVFNLLRTYGTMANRGPYRNPPPAPATETSASAPRAIILREFGKRLQNAMMERGWNQAELARAATRHTAGKKLSRANVSNYIRGVALPGPMYLRALSKALGMNSEELLPARAYPTVDEHAPPLDVKELDNGLAWLRVNQAVDWEVALKVLGLLKGA